VDKATEIVSAQLAPKFSIRGRKGESPLFRTADRASPLAYLASNARLSEALKPLHRLEAEARKANGDAAKAYAVEAEAFKLRKEAAQKKGRAAMKDSDANLSSILSIDEPVGASRFSSNSSGRLTTFSPCRAMESRVALCGFARARRYEASGRKAPSRQAAGCSTG
jgi:hypothetical protein